MIGGCLGCTRPEQRHKMTHLTLLLGATILTHFPPHRHRSQTCQRAARCKTHPFASSVLWFCGRSRLQLLHTGTKKGDQDAHLPSFPDSTEPSHPRKLSICDSKTHHIISLPLATNHFTSLVSLLHHPLFFAAFLCYVSQVDEGFPLSNKNSTDTHGHG